MSGKDTLEAFHIWLDRKLRVDAHELRDDKVVITGWPRRSFKLAEIRTWQGFYIGGGVPSIFVEFAGGRKTDFSDRFEQLFRIFQKTAPDKESEFIAS